MIKRVKDRAIRVVSMAMALFLAVGNIGTGITIKAADTYSMSYHSEIYLDTGELLDTLYHDDAFNDYYMTDIDTNSYSSGDTITIQRKPFYREAVEGSLELHNDIDVDVKYPNLQFLGYKLYKSVGATVQYVGICQVGDSFINDGASYYVEGVYHDTNSANPIAYAAENLTSGNYTYNLTMENKAVIKQFTGSAVGTVSAPSSLGGYQVTEILSGAFTNLGSGVTLEIPDNMIVHEYAIKNYAPSVIKLGRNIIFPDSNPVYGYLGFPRYLENAYATDGAGYYKQVFISPNTTWVKQHEITYARNDGTDYTFTDTSRYIAGEEVALVSPQKREDYEFLGWTLAQAYTEGDTLYSAYYTMPADDVLMYGQWEVSEDCIVTYDTSAVGGLGTITDPTIYKVGDEVTILDCSTSAASGYEVEGIYENADYSGTKYSVGDKFTISSDKGFYVRYVAIGYHLSFNKNGGDSDIAEDTNIYNSGDVAALPSLSSLTRTGYKAIGFSTSPLTLSKSASLTPFGSNFMYGMDMIYTANYSIYDNTLLYVVWQEENVVAGTFITYEGNGADGGTTPIDPTNYTNIYNPATVRTNTFTRTDYDFAGWNTKADGTGTNYNEGQSVGAFLILNAGKKLYAQWTPKAKQKFNLNFDMGIGAMYVSAPPTAQYDEGTEVSLPTPSTTSFMTSLTQGYSFNGWDIQNPYTITADTFATAQWQAICKVRYSGGPMITNVPFDNNNYQPGDVVTVVGPTPLTDGFTFTGYYIEQLGITVQIGDTFIIPSTGANLTAQWTPNAVIPPTTTEKYHTFYSAGADTTIISPVDSNEYAKGDVVTVLSGVIVDGYTFKGWWCTELSKLVQPGEQLTMGKSDYHMVAMLEKNQPPVVVPTEPTPTPDPVIPTPDPTPVVTGPAIEITPTPEPSTPTPEPTEEPSVTPEPTTPPEPTEEPSATPEPTNPPEPTGEPTATPEPPAPTEVPPVVVTPTPELPVVVTPIPVPPVIVTPVPTTPVSPEPIVTTEPTKEPEVIYGKVFGIITGIDGKPKAGVLIELHSKPRITYTDAEGRYSFEDVELGNHTLILKDPRTLETLGVNTVVVHDLTSGDKQEIKVDDTTDMVTGEVSLDEIQTERQIDFELVKDLAEDTNNEEPIDDTTKDEDKTEDAGIDTGKASDDTSIVDDTGKKPIKDEGKVDTETKQPTPTPSVIDPEIVDPEPTPEVDEPTPSPEPTPDKPEPTPYPEVVEPTPSPDPVPDKPVPNPIIPIAVATVPPMFFIFFIWFIRRLYVLVKDSEGRVIKRKHRIRKPFLKSKPVIINMARYKKRLGSLEGITIEISKKTLKKLKGYEIRVIENKKNKVVLYQYKVESAKEICRITLPEEDN